MSEALRKIDGYKIPEENKIYTFKSFGEQLKEARKKEGITQQDLGILMYPNLKKATCMYKINKLETGWNLPTEDELSKLNDLFKMKFITKTRADRRYGMRTNVEKTMMKIPDDLPDKVRAYMKENGLTRHSLSKKLGCSDSPIYAIVDGKGTSLSKVTYQKITALIDYKEEEPKTKVPEVPVVVEPVIHQNEEVSTSRIDKCFMENVSKYVTSKEDEERLCRNVGVVPRYFRRNQNDIAPVTLELAIKVSKYLNVSVEDLCVDNEKARLEKEIKELKEKLAALDSQ